MPSEQGRAGDRGSVRNHDGGRGARRGAAAGPPRPASAAGRSAAPLRHAGPAVRRERRRRLLEHPASGRERPRERCGHRGLPRRLPAAQDELPERPAAEALLQGASDVRGSRLRLPRPARRGHPEVLQGRDLRREGGRRRADLLAARPQRRDDRPRRGLRRPAHLRQHARRARCSASATWAPRTACSRWTRSGTPAAHSSPPSPAGRAATARWTTPSGSSRPTTRPTSSASLTSATRSTAPPAPRSSEDVTNYVAGINRYIQEARVNPTKMPGEYAAIGKPGPQDWKVTDVIATASLVGGIFGKGGGNELESALLYQERPPQPRQAARHAGLEGPTHRRGPGGARHRAAQALPLPRGAAPAPARRRGAPRHGQRPDDRGRAAGSEAAARRRRPARARI